MIATIETRHEEGLQALLSPASSLLNDGLLDAGDMVRLMQALSDLCIETRYDEIILDRRKAVSVSLIRVECVKLAVALITRVNDDGTLQAWIDAAKSDALPEVRFSIADA